MSTWNIDPAHSEIGFKVKHLVISTVKGKFGIFTGSVTAADDTFANAALTFEADVAGINTGNAQRDGHIQSPDFFDAAQFPKVTFVSKAFTKKEGNNFDIVGDLTMRGVTKEETLHATLNGIAKSPVDGSTVAAFDVTGMVNRKDFGISWNAAMETGGVVAGDEVMLDATVELKKAA